MVRTLATEVNRAWLTVALLVRLRIFKHQARNATARSAKWRKANPERAKAHALRGYYRHHEARKARRRADPRARRNVERWQAANPEKVLGYKRRWQEANKARHSATTIAWQRRNIESVRAHRRINQARRRARKFGLSAHYTAAEWQALCSETGHRCLRCGCSDRPLTPDHVQPLARGGVDTIDNIQPLCQRCNASKNSKTIDYRAAASDCAGRVHADIDGR